MLGGEIRGNEEWVWGSIRDKKFFYRICHCMNNVCKFLSSIKGHSVFSLWRGTQTTDSRDVN